MKSENPKSYLESKVMTASSAQLHLMLVEGAIRFCTRAQRELANNNEGHANEAMVRAIDIIGEMLAGVRGGESDINQKLGDLYQFLFHTLTSAYVNTDAQKLEDVMRILEFERETWQLACERAHAEVKQQPSGNPIKAPIIAPHIATPSPSSGLSLEA